MSPASSPNHPPTPPFLHKKVGLLPTTDHHSLHKLPTPNTFTLPSASVPLVHTVLLDEGLQLPHAEVILPAQHLVQGPLHTIGQKHQAQAGATLATKHTLLAQLKGKHNVIHHHLQADVALEGGGEWLADS